jgi:hypothetical protein
MFRDPALDAMKGGKIRWALRRTRYAFGIEFDYFKKIDGSQNASKNAASAGFSVASHFRFVRPSQRLAMLS